MSLILYKNFTLNAYTDQSCYFWKQKTSPNHYELAQVDGFVLKMYTSGNIYLDLY